MGEGESRKYKGQAEIKVVLHADEPHPAEGSGERGTDEDRADRAVRLRHSKLLVVFNGLLCAFTAIYATVAILQWCTMDSALELTRREVTGSLRAWVLPGSLYRAEDSPSGWRILLRNFGSTPALNIHVSLKNRTTAEERPNWCEKGAIEDGEITKVYALTASGNLKLTIPAPSGAPGPGGALFVACVRYDDGVGKGRWTSVCYRPLGTAQPSVCDAGNLNDASEAPQ